MHKYTPYRPKWCEHPSFEGFDYCWGLACSVDDGILQKFLADKCKHCELSKHYQGYSPTIESLDDIVRRAEGLGRELEEKMRRR